MSLNCGPGPTRHQEAVSKELEKEVFDAARTIAATFSGGVPLESKAMRDALSKQVAKERLKAQRRWFFAKKFVEPRLKEAANDETALSFLPNHEFVLRSFAKAQIAVKCRKTAHSWGYALFGVCAAATEPRSTTIIGSYDEDEAKEKLTFVDWIFDVLPNEIKRQLKMSDGTEVRKFANGSRIRFISNKAPTGAGASIIFDEFSVELPGRATPAERLIAALGATTHTGQVFLGGTQRGPDTLFIKILNGGLTEIFKDNPVFLKLVSSLWEVGRFPWWTSPALSTDPVQGAIEAPTLDTADRVEKFGNEKLQLQYALYCGTPELGLEMFQREFEMMVLDDKDSYFTFELINDCYPKDDKYWFDFIEVDGTKYDSRYGDILEEAKRKVKALEREIKIGRLDGEWGWAMDIGRHHDADEIWIGHVPKHTPELLCLRLNIGMQNMPFPGKREIISYIMQNLPVRRGYIDGTRGGLGVDTAEWAFKHYNQRAMTFTFDDVTKSIICTGLKARMQNLGFMIGKHPKFTKWQRQCLAVKKLESGTHKILFDVQRTKQFHGDCFWSSAMISDLFHKKLRWRPHGGVALEQNVGSNTDYVSPIIIARS